MPCLSYVPVIYVEHSHIMRRCPTCPDVNERKADSKAFNPELKFQKRSWAFCSILVYPRPICFPKYRRGFRGGTWLRITANVTVLVIQTYTNYSHTSFLEFFLPFNHGFLKGPAWLVVSATCNSVLADKTTPGCPCGFLHYCRPKLVVPPKCRSGACLADAADAKSIHLALFLRRCNRSQRTAWLLFTAVTHFILARRGNWRKPKLLSILAVKDSWDCQCTHSS